MQIYDIGINVIISIIVAIITAKLSLNSFYKQEIWLRKEKQYSEIINGLNKMQKHYGDMFDYYIDDIESYPNEKSYDEEIKKIRRDLEIISLSPSLILKPDVHIILQNLFNYANSNEYYEANNDIVSYLDNMYGETKDACIKIVEIARKDLKLKL